MRATRVGGSFSSSARALGAAKLKRPAKHSSRLRLLLPVNVIVFMTNPLFSSWDAGRSGPLMRRSSRRERNILLLPLGRTPQWERSCHLGQVARPLERVIGGRLFIFDKLSRICTLEQVSSFRATAGRNKGRASSAYCRWSSRLWLSRLDPKSEPKPL